MKYKININDKCYNVEIREKQSTVDKKNFSVKVDDEEYDVTAEIIKETKKRFIPQIQQFQSSMSQVSVELKNETDKSIDKSSDKHHLITAPMAGKVTRVNVKIGDKVEKDNVVIILEAMKMENSITTTVSGVVERINISAGDVVKAGDVLCEIKIE